MLFFLFLFLVSDLLSRFLFLCLCYFFYSHNDFLPWFLDSLPFLLIVGCPPLLSLSLPLSCSLLHIFFVIVIWDGYCSWVFLDLVIWIVLLHLLFPFYVTWVCFIFIFWLLDLICSILKNGFLNVFFLYFIYLADICMF